MTLVREKTGMVTFKGNPITLLGDDILEGSLAPEFRVVGNDLSPVTLADSAGKVRLLSVYPSLDTGLCDTMGRQFNQRAAALPSQVEVYAISLDLPFAQKRWCGSAGIERLRTLSDYQDRSFGLNYGVLMKELKLLARSVWVIDRDGMVTYRQIVPEGTHEPDYDAALAAVGKLL
jgi:thioredoxin-dependent peroxiredoxin